MFTGLIEAVGRVEAAAAEATGQRLSIASPFAGDLSAGDSVAVNGVCLTAVSVGPAAFSATVSPETLRVTTLGELRAGDAVNLERPMRADGRLGGHFVLGHVDGVGEISAIRPDGDCYWVDVTLPGALLPLCISKGSIAIDGISLTIAQLCGDAVRVQIVPFTWTHTALSGARPGQRVNVEADVIGKYVARLMSFDPRAAGQAELYDFKVR
jgi:riboflavin synthase